MMSYVKFASALLGYQCGSLPINHIQSGLSMHAWRVHGDLSRDRARDQTELLKTIDNRGSQ